MTRTKLLCCAAVCLLVAPVVVTGQARTPGQSWHPQPSPANPDLVIYERLEGDRIELQLLDVTTGAGRSVVSGGGSERSDDPFALDALSGAAGAVSRYAAEMDWRPVEEGGRQWFVFVQGSGELHLSWVDRAGQLAPQTVHLAYAGVATSPKWSPDGRRLAFASGGSIYVTDDIRGALRPGLESFDLGATPVQGLDGALFPAWAPDGRSIAVQRRNAEGGWEVVIAALGGDVPPVVASRPMAEYNAYRPSWSPDGSRLAFYVEQGRRGSGEGQELLDIAAVEVIRDSNGIVFRSEALRGRSPRWVENVVPDLRRGPDWFGPADDPWIAFVRKDEARGNPVQTANLAGWTSMQPSERYVVDVSSAGSWNTVNNRFVVASSTPEGARFVFASQEGNDEVIQVRDQRSAALAAADEGSGSSATQSVTGLSAGSLRLRSAFVPGWGQWIKGDKGKAVLFGGAFAAAAGFTLAKAIPAATDDEGVSNWSPFSHLDQDYGKAFAVGLAVWLINVIDAGTGVGSSGAMAGLSVSPAATGGVSVSWALPVR